VSGCDAGNDEMKQIALKRSAVLSALSTRSGSVLRPNTRYNRPLLKGLSDDR